jgi:hypothetical protein
MRLHADGRKKKKNPFDLARLERVAHALAGFRRPDDPVLQRPQAVDQIGAGRSLAGAADRGYRRDGSEDPAPGTQDPGIRNQE